MIQRYKDFPPGWGHLKVPTGSRDAALAALALYAPCRPPARLLHRAAWLAVKLTGPRTIPGRATPWDPGAQCEIWPDLTEILHREVGAFDAIAGYERLQRSRSGFALLLLHAGTPVAFVKLREGDASAVATEYRATDAVARYGPRTFTVPRPLLYGSVRDWHYLALEPLTPGLHGPATHPPLGLLTSEIRDALGVLPKPTGVDASWEPMHGDFAPWNLRATRHGLVLIDWEDSSWGPPGSDEVFYRAARAALRLGDATASPYTEAIAYWKSKIAGRDDGKRDARLSADMTAALDRMTPSHPRRSRHEQRERPRVLVFAYACEPGRGSEPGAGWGLVRSVSEFADCVVLTAPEHMPAVRSVERSLPGSSMEFVEVPEPSWAPFARKHRVTWFLLYVLWLRRARAIGHRLASASPFDLTHHATYSTYWLASPAVRFGVPVIWGPVGGAVTTPGRLWGYLGWRGCFDEIVDFIGVRAMALLPNTRRSWTGATVRIVQNEATLAALPRRLRAGTWVLNHALFTDVPTADRADRTQGLLLVSSLESRKGVALALHALASASDDVHLTIVGEGPQRRSLERLARRLRIAKRVTFRGRVPRAQVADLVSAAAAVVFTGLREEGGLALAEAMICGAPVIVLANGGARTIAALGTDAARVVLIEPTGPDDTARRLGEAMTRFAHRPPLVRTSLIDQATAKRALRAAFSEVYSLQPDDVPPGAPEPHLPLGETRVPAVAATLGSVPRESVVSVVIPTHNRRELLAHTLGSVLAQRDVTVQVVVVDDGSTDGTCDAVANLGDPRVRLVRHDHALGVSAARNRGVVESTGEWVAFLDDDDLWAPDKLALQLACAEEAAADWVYGGCVALLPTRETSGAGPPPRGDIVRRQVPWRNIVPGGASNVIVRRRVLDRVGGFDTSLRHMSDWDLWIRLAETGRPGVVDAPVVAYRLHAGNASIDTADIAREMSVVEARFARLRRGAPVDRAYVYRWIAWNALRAGRRREALRAYAHAVRAGDVISAARAAVAILSPETITARMRRASDRSYEARAAQWLGPLVAR